ncbi:dTDP-4-dehydrorhamnose reductase [Algibacter sp. AS12]|uniref:dTDP-4-dehydrorhamnose reductase n=1 Tax=Algibacter sp. AS12 TaxID=3135773 RepID=UPI00398ADE02
MNKKVLVTGANGQLGQTIKEINDSGILDIDFTFVTKADLSITNPKDLLQYFSTNTFDYCINCAAYTNVEQAEKTPEEAYNINSDGVKLLSEYCKTYNVILIHISTDYVFNGEKQAPYLTTDCTNPINEYGKSKLLGEKNIQENLEKYFIIRTSWLYSKKYGNNFYKTILSKSETEKELYITTKQVGCPTDTVNLTNYILNLIQNDYQGYGILHFCDLDVMSWYDFAIRILEENNKSQQTQIIKSNKYKTLARRPKYSVLKISDL